MLLLLATLTGCMQYHLPEASSRSTQNEKVTIRIIYAEGDPVEINGLRDFGSMIFDIEGPADVTVSINRITTSFTHRINGENGVIPTFLPGFSGKYFERCGLYAPRALSPMFVAENPGGPLLSFFPPIGGEGLAWIPTDSSSELKILCALEDPHVPHIVDLALETATFRQGLNIVAMRDDGTIVDEEDIVFIVESVNGVDDSPRWFQTVEPTLTATTP